MRLRRMNDAVRQRRDEFGGDPADVHSLMCECAAATCSEMLRIAVAELDAARLEPTTFIVAPEHVGDIPVVARAKSHVVVRMPEA